MNVANHLLAAALLLLAAGCSPSTAERIEEADALLRAGIPMTDSARQQAQALVEEARRLHGAGDAAGADAAADKALALLRRAKDAALINKSDG